MRSIFSPLHLGCVSLICLTLLGCDPGQVRKTMGMMDPFLGKGSSKSGLSQFDVINGLKSALKVGSQNASNSLHRKNAYFSSPLIKILFPPEAQIVADTMNRLGMSSLVSQVVLSLNRAAEDAAIKARPVFWSAIKSMTIQDGMKILKGSNSEATLYLKGKTSASLARVFRPQISSSLSKVHATKYWRDIMTQYNRVPFMKKINPDLTGYVTKRALSGLFSTIAKEEAQIRKNPMKRVNSILKKVFGFLDGKS